MFSDRGIKFSSRGTLLFLGDLFCVAGSWYLAAVLRLNAEFGLEYIVEHQMPIVACCAIFLLIFYISGLYERPALVSRRSLIGPLFASVTISVVLIVLAFYAQFTVVIGRGILFMAGVFTLLSVLMHRHFLNIAAGFGLFSKNTLVVGSEKDADKVIRLISRTKDSGYKIYGVVTTTSDAPGGFIQGIPILGNVNKVKGFVKAYEISTIIVAMPLHRENALIRLLRPLRYSGVEILDYASCYEVLAQEIPIDHIDDEWLMHAAMNSSRIHIQKLKRVMDVLVSLLGLVILLPISLLAALAVRLDSRGPVFYRQKRVGLDDKSYTLYKFRTMREDAEKETGAVWAEKKDKRITRVGHFLRKARIDEIPQLINVLRGEMSLVGPRPERPEFIEALSEATPYYKERLLVPSGITGWAQIRYPYAASVDAARRKLQFDLYYIKHMSFFLDCLILLKTFKTILVGLKHSEDFEAQEHEDEKILRLLPDSDEKKDIQSA